jgi:hypothetical protein
VRDVSFSSALKLLLAVLLPLTLVWKLTVKPENRDQPEDDIVAFLARQGFHAVVAEDMILPGIRAVNGACHMRIMMPSYYGADRDIARSLVAADESLMFVHQGRIYREQPTLQTLWAELWARSLRRIGLIYHRVPVLAVVAPRQCEAERLPWDQLQ